MFARLFFPPAAVSPPFRNSTCVRRRGISLFLQRRHIIPGGALFFWASWPRLSRVSLRKEAVGAAFQSPPTQNTHSSLKAAARRLLRAWLTACVTNSTRFVVVCPALIKMWVLSEREKEKPWHSWTHHVTRCSLSKQLSLRFLELARTSFPPHCNH